LIKLRIATDHWKITGERLGSDHAIERIAMLSRQAVRAKRAPPDDSATPC
jgi:hypothetical protein